MTGFRRKIQELSIPASQCRRSLALALAALAALSGCSEKTPTGQVVAIVDGEEITRRDLASELRASGAAENTDIKKLGPLLIDRIVARKLLVKQAREDGIDKTPEYLSEELRQREGLLASMLAQRWASQIPEPTTSALEAFVTANPQMFESRKILLVDQISTSAAGLDLKQLEPLNTNDAVAALFSAQKHPFQRARTTLDTLAAPKALIDQIAKLPPGMPFVINEGGTLLISAVIGARPAPLSGAQQTLAAKAAMKRLDATKAVESQLASLRLGAKIEYQPGFAPPPRRKPAN